MIRPVLAVLLVAAWLTAPAQVKDEEVIRWHPQQRLTWADYKGKVKTDSDAAASTATYLGLEYNFGRNGFDYTITCSFSKTRSWGLHKTDYILAHEQGHFDIAEIFARKLNQQLKAYRFDRNNFKEDLKKIYVDLTTEKDALQNQYDRETNHSINKEKQAEWLKKIESLLSEFADYADYNN